MSMYLGFGLGEKFFDKIRLIEVFMKYQVSRNVIVLKMTSKFWIGG